MNDFERRLLDVMQNSSYLAAIARDNQKILAIDYFAYNAQILQLTTAQAGQAIIPIQADSDFVLTYISAGAVQNGVLLALPYALLQITDTGTGKTFFSAPTLLNLVSGQGGFPFLLPSPRVIAPNVNIKLDIQNNQPGGAGPYPTDYYISLLGARVYYA